MASGHGRSHDAHDAYGGRNSGAASGASGAGSGDGLGGMDDADVADLWVLDPDTGAYRMRTPEELAAANAAEAAPTPGTALAVPSPTRSPERSPVPAPRRRTTQPATRPGKNGKSGKAKKRLKWIALSLAGLFVVIVGAAYGYYEYLNSRIKTGDRSGNSDVGAAGEDEQGRRQMNVLLIGSDSRVGKGNTGYGNDDEPGRADTTLLLHLSADRSNASVVSIPRDMFVDRPSCKHDKGTQPAQEHVAFNTTMIEPGGPPCTVATVERMLGVRIDHWMMIDFNGVKQMTKAVGGVDIVLCDRLYDPKGPGRGTGLDLAAGPHNLQGEDALSFLRARHGFYGESDLARIEAQKSFLMALAREIKTSATWKDPAAVFQIAQAATGNITVDEGLGRIEKLVSLGNEIKKVPEKRMAFTTLPVMDVPEENPKVHVQAIEPQATNLWATVRNDTPLTKGDPGAAPPAASSAPAPAAPAAPTIDPATISVSVRNSTQVPKAQEVVDKLLAAKYKASVDKTGGSQQANSSITYPTGQLDAARQLAAAVGLPETALDESSKAGTKLQLVIGLDFPGLKDGADSAGTGSSGKASSGGSAPAPAPTATVAPPKAEDIKLNTADNDSCIKTKYSK
ncbi:LCP family protein [Yinghuangia sp. ASG 101]|uniref:LCP family protein n=1 Tax=Yinghuangia sp. ASG 101 TaxID=2896848 RepID=UPI001E440356|nr:LCP family protein [Yinghuangia sp. ASG 101]UGQ09529.1 LCP family protein [Yinghuangia sp. ASG 101]